MKLPCLRAYRMASGTVLGAFSHAAFEERTIQFQPGDRLVVFSDGFAEAGDNDGDWHVQQIRSFAPRYSEGLAGALASLAVGMGEQADDITVVEIRPA